MLLFTHKCSETKQADHKCEANIEGMMSSHAHGLSSPSSLEGACSQSRSKCREKGEVRKSTGGPGSQLVTRPRLRSKGQESRPTPS